MRILYPCEPFEPRIPDAQFAAEHAAVCALGVPCSLFSHEDFLAGRFRMLPPPVAGEQVLYRGWMLAAPQQYQALVDAIEAAGAQPFTHVQDYELCHHLPQWYPLLSELTAPTQVFSADDDYLPVLSSTGWEAFFVKDFVKSLTTARGSIARSPGEVPEIASQISRFRGGVEGGICVRRFEELVPGSERRFFVLHGKPCAADGETIPALVAQAAERIRSPFFCVDIAQRSDGAWCIVELGDGQVSDRKHWSAERMAQLLASAR